MLSEKKLKWWFEKRADWEMLDACMHGLIEDEGKWYLTDGYTAFVLAEKPDIPYADLQDTSVPSIIKQNIDAQDVRWVPEITAETIKAKRKADLSGFRDIKDRRTLIEIGAAYYNARKALDISMVMGAGCRFYTAGKSWLDWLIIYPKDDWRSFAILMPYNKEYDNIH